MIAGGASRSGGLGLARRVACALLVILSPTGTLAGCRDAAPSIASPRDPSIVGVVQSIEFVGPRAATITLAKGESVQIDFEAAERLVAGAPSEGDLLFYGSDAAGAWYVALPPSGDTFRIFTNLVATDAGTITFEFDLRLPLAPNYREGDGPFEPGAPAIYRVNEKGEVTELE